MNNNLCPILKGGKQNEKQTKQNRWGSKRDRESHNLKKRRKKIISILLLIIAILAVIMVQKQGENVYLWYNGNESYVLRKAY